MVLLQILLNTIQYLNIISDKGCRNSRECIAVLRFSFQIEVDFRVIFISRSVNWPPRLDSLNLFFYILNQRCSLINQRQYDLLKETFEVIAKILMDLLLVSRTGENWSFRLQCILPGLQPYTGNSVANVCNNTNISILHIFIAVYHLKFCHSKINALYFWLYIYYIFISYI